MLQTTMTSSSSSLQVPKFILEEPKLFITWLPVLNPVGAGSSMEFAEKVELPNIGDAERMGLYSPSSTAGINLSTNVKLHKAPEDETEWRKEAKRALIPSKIHLLIYTNGKEDFNKVEDWLRNLRTRQEIGISTILGSPFVMESQMEPKKEFREKYEALKKLHEEGVAKIKETSSQMGIKMRVQPFHFPNECMETTTVTYNYKNVKHTIVCSRGTSVYNILHNCGLLLETFPEWYCQRLITSEGTKGPIQRDGKETEHDKQVPEPAKQVPEPAKQVPGMKWWEAPSCWEGQPKDAARREDGGMKWWEAPSCWEGQPKGVVGRSVTSTSIKFGVPEFIGGRWVSTNSSGDQTDLGPCIEPYQSIHDNFKTKVDQTTE